MTRLSRFVTYALVGLAILCYAIADSRPAFALVMLALGAVGIALTERRGSRGLPRVAILALVALALANAAHAATTARLTVSEFSEFVTFLQVIKLFDKRRARDYAQLLALAVFQVIGALLTSNALAVGAMLIVFVPGVALGAALQQIAAAAEHAPARAPHARGHNARRHLITVAAACALGATLGGVVAFLFVPRGLGSRRMGDWGNVSLGQTTAFTDEVNLGVGGLISESQTEVLDLAVTNRVGQDIGSHDRIFYLRGAVLDTYDAGRWTLNAERTFTRHFVDPRTAWPLGGRPNDADTNARITIRNASERVGYLFSIWHPTQILLHDPGGVIETGPHGIIRRDSATGKYEYTIRADTSGRASPRTTEQRRERTVYSDRIRDLADQILEDARIEPDPDARPPSDDELAVRALESHLRGNYGYTLDITAAPPGRDATEHFLFTRREGHCEYFASALASMCRAVGIEARVVTGYIAVEYVEGAAKYVVRESNAHAWVEAPLDRGRWITADATPPAALSEVHRPRSGLIARARRFIDSVELAWIHGIVGFDERSRAAVLGQQPLNPARIEQRVADFNLRMSVGGLSLAARAARNAVLTFAGVVLIGLGVSAILSVARSRLRTARTARIKRSRPDAAHAPADVARLFEHLESTLARKGHPRPAWTGALAHADRVAKADAAATQAPEIVRLYYAARFGGAPPQPHALRNARRALQSIRRMMVREKPSPRSRRAT